MLKFLDDVLANFAGADRAGVGAATPVAPVITSMQSYNYKISKELNYLIKLGTHKGEIFERYAEL